MTAPSPMTMRRPCTHCGELHGSITTQNGQDVVRCYRCSSYQYCAPRSETGREVRRVSRSTLKPKKRARILRIHNNSCVGCGASPPRVELSIGHLVPYEDAREMGLDMEVVDHDFNLAPMCPECNLGLGRSPVAIGLMYRLLQLHIRSSNQETNDQ